MTEHTVFVVIMLALLDTSGGQDKSMYMGIYGITFDCSSPWKYGVTKQNYGLQRSGALNLGHFKSFPDKAVGFED